MDKVELIKKMISLNPVDSHAWYLLGLEYAQNHQIAEALQAFTEALKYGDDALKQDIIVSLGKLSQVVQKHEPPAASSVQDKILPFHSEKQEPLHKRSKENPFHAVENRDSSAEGNREAREVRDNQDTQDNQNDPDDYDDQKVFDDDDNNDDDDDDDNNDPNDCSLDSGSESDKSNLVPLRVVGGRKNTGSIIEEEKWNAITFSDVGGLEELKDTIRMKIIKPFSSPGLFEKFRKKSGGGILLFGPPGCGKTYIAKATAGECGASFIPVSITDILDPYLGVSSQNIRNVFSSARAKRPCVLFFDEIDTLGFSRARLSSEHMRPVIDQLLTEIEGIESNNDRMLIIGATNMPWDVDSALKRPGRFDRLIFVMPPDLSARKEIFLLKMQDRPSETLDYDELARETELYSGADIENVVERATETVLESILNTGNERKITMQDLRGAIEQTSPSTLEWLKTIRTYVKYANNSMYSDVEKYLKKVKRYLD